MENWEVVEDAPKYLVSDHGRVMNDERRYILSPGYAGSGYLQVHLWRNKEKIHRYVHRLVATAFVDGWGPGLEVNHLDGDKKNNVASNLEWVTRSRNARHASELGLYGKHILIVETGQIFISLTDCAEHIGGDVSNISHCLSGRRRSHRGFTFEFVE